MPIPTITPSYVRTNANWGEYQPYIFRFLYTVGTTDYYYDCVNIPEGWNAQSIKITRNRSNIGLVRTYTEGVSFVGADAFFLKDYFDTYRFNIPMTVEIYKLNPLTVDYDVYYEGFADFTKWNLKDSKFKIDLVDNQVQSMIENNGSKEYSLLPSEYSPYLLDFEYSGVELFEIGTFEGSPEPLPNPPFEIPQKGSVAVNDVYLYLPLGGDSLVAKTYNVDTKLSTFASQIIEYNEYSGTTEISNSTPFFTAGITGRFYGRINPFSVDLAVEYPILNQNNDLIKDIPEYYNLFLHNGEVGSGQSYYSISSGALSFTHHSWEADDVASTSILIEDNSFDFAINSGDEVFLTLALYRYNICIFSSPITIVNGYIKLFASIKETYIPKQIKGIPFSSLLSLSLLKSTNGIGRIVNNSLVDFTRVIMFNGNLIRNFLTYNLNVKLSDLLTFIMRKYGIGYEMNGYNLTFYKIGDFFDNTEVGYSFDNPTNFEILSTTDLIYSTIKSGDKQFDSEYLSGKFSVHEETIFKTQIDVVTNELDLMCDISTNPFEIEDMVRKAIDTETLTDYEGDYQLVAILANLKEDDLWQIDRAFVEEESMPIDYFYPDTIFNLQFSPIRIIERNLMPIHQTLYNDCDTIKAQKRTKYEGFYCSFLGENVKHEFEDFTIYPRCTTTTGVYLTNSYDKIEPKIIQFTMPTTQFNLPSLLANAKKKMKVTQNGVEYFGFLDDFGLNILTNEPQTVRLIEAKTT